MKKTLTVLMVLLMAAGMAFANGETEGDAEQQFARPGVGQPGLAQPGMMGRGRAGWDGRRDPQQAYQAATELLERAEEVSVTGSFALTRDVPTIVTNEGTYVIAGPGVQRYARMLEEGVEMELSGLVVRPEHDLPLVVDGMLHVESAMIAGEVIELSDRAARLGSRMMDGAPRRGPMGRRF